MVRKALFVFVMLLGLAAIPRQAIAGCTTDLFDCYQRAARQDSFWYRFAEGLDCELDYAGCVRRRLTGF